MFHKSHSSEFSRRSIDARRAWFSTALYELFLNELKREKEFLRTHPGEKPFFGEGLPFQPWDETCTVGKRILHKQLTLKPDAEDAANATVQAIFAFRAPCKEPDQNEYTFELVKENGKWVIDNLNYEEGSSLVKDLKRKDY